MWPPDLIQSQTEATNVISEMKYPKVQRYDFVGLYLSLHTFLLRYMLVCKTKCADIKRQTVAYW